ncbi:F-box/LRR-repeat protein fbxl-1-like [Liolophura sinensis]|uniref:F-box/LRR-repeat protein fbxl-1-like n=1 Tax=Liolophura sinensis TaxID=3198878 RepID=UPI0031582A72
MYVPDLLSLDISYVDIRKCSGTCLETFFQHNRNLAKFTIHWKDLTNGIVSSMASEGEMLEEIALVDCDQVTCSGIQDIGKHCQKLRGLDLKGVCFLTDAALWPCLSRGQLRHLSLAECGISDVTLRWICQYLSETVESLDLAWCDEITETGVNTLLSRDHPNLRTLSLHQGPASDHTLTLLAEHCSQLTSLVLCSVRFGIDDEAVVNLAQRLPHLTKIDISWNSGLTDKSPSAFLTFCQKLEWANFAGIKRITSEPFIHLISDDGSWLKTQAMLRKDRLDRQRRQVDAGGTQVDKETRPVRLPFRSGVFCTTSVLPGSGILWTWWMTSTWQESLPCAGGRSRFRITTDS